MATLPQDQSREGCKLGNMSTSHVEIGVTAAKADALADARAKAAAAEAAAAALNAKNARIAAEAKKHAKEVAAKNKAIAAKAAAKNHAKGSAGSASPAPAAHANSSAAAPECHTANPGEPCYGSATWCAQSLCPTVDVATGSLPPPLYHYISCISYHERYW